MPKNKSESVDNILDFLKESSGYPKEDNKEEDSEERLKRLANEDDEDDIVMPQMITGAN
jgi:hypothetical protein